MSLNFAVLILCGLLILGTAENQEEEASEALSPAEELIRAAEKAGYNLTLADIDLAESASTEEEVSEALPSPVAEALIGYRRRNDLDFIREQMIGLIFTGQPTPLGYDRRRYYKAQIPPRIRAFPRPISNRRFDYVPEAEESISNPRKLLPPKEILKPIAFSPGPSKIEFSPSLGSRGHRPPPPPKPSRFRPNEFFSSEKEFKTPSGPDFGSVTFEEFGARFPDEFDHRPPPPSRRPPMPPHHFRKPPRPPPHRPPQTPTSFTKFEVGRPNFDSGEFNRDRPISVRPKPAKRRPSLVSEPNKLDTNKQSSVTEFAKHDGDCPKYTENICLDTDRYPHEAILAALEQDLARMDTLMAEESEQSADNLVDGVSAAQESKYDFTHYYGTRRQIEGLPHRDFASEGGYLCPSEVKYARPKRARNSKGQWKFLVNLEKYTQTIRMEKCLKPGGSCSYVSHHYKASCHQVHNYQRLLSWEKDKGLHMDIFKVPSSCTCHVDGYAYVFPPLNGHDKTARQEIAESEVFASFLPPPDTIEDINAIAPPYSPVNFPNLVRVSRVGDASEQSPVVEPPNGTENIE